MIQIRTFFTLFAMKSHIFDSELDSFNFLLTKTLIRKATTDKMGKKGFIQINFSKGN